MAKTIIDANTLTVETPKTRATKALRATDVEALLDLAKEYDPALYRKLSGEKVTRVKVLIERRLGR